MDYSLHYERLISRARARCIAGYVERHHVIPRCLGGEDGAGNIALLTPEEHFVAHQLLTKMHPGNKKLVYGLWRLTHSRDGNGVPSNKAYGWVKRLHSKTRSADYMGVPQSAESRLKKSLVMKGRKQDSAHAAKQCAARTGAKRSLESRERMRLAQIGKKRSPESIAKRAAKLIGKKRTPEQIEKISLSNKETYKLRLVHKALHRGVV